MPKSSIGLRAKTARAIAVVLSGPPVSPHVTLRRELTLRDPAVRATFQPFHEVMDLPWPKAMQAARKTASVIKTVSEKALRALLEEAREAGIAISGVGIVGSPDRDLAKIGNPHMRAHAAEGCLFRKVLEDAADACSLSHSLFLERELYDHAAAVLKLSTAQVKTRIQSLGEAVGPPWRADEKAAAAAAWIVLAIQ